MMEDVACGRLEKGEEEEERVRREIGKMVPENYRIAIMPMWFGYTDCERIRRVVGERA
jgi:acetyl-CoA carboxylase alpha subunit